MTLAELEARSLNINMMNTDDLQELFKEQLAPEEDESDSEALPEEEILPESVFIDELEPQLSDPIIEEEEEETVPEEPVVEDIDVPEPEEEIPEEEPEPEEIVEEEPEPIEIVEEEIEPELEEVIAAEIDTDFEELIEEMNVPDEIIETPVIEAIEPESEVIVHQEVVEDPVEEAEEEPAIEMRSIVVRKPEPKIDVEAEKQKRQQTKKKTDQLLKSLNFDLSSKLKQTTDKKKKTITRDKNWKGIESARSVVSSNKNLVSNTLLEGEWKYPEMTPAQLRTYMPVVNTALKSHWHVPVALDPTLQVLVSVLVAKDGRIIKYDSVETSGSKIFDQAVNNVFSSLKKFPPLPESFPGEFTEIGLRFTSSL